MARPPRQPDAIRTAYSAALKKLTTSAIREISNVLRGKTNITEADLARAYAQWLHTYPDIKLLALLEPYAVRTNNLSSKEMSRLLGTRLQEPWLTAQIPTWVDENVQLIRKNVENNVLVRLRATLTTDVVAGARWEELSKHLIDAGNILIRHARLIARDQVGKLYGSVNHSRQVASGVSRYIWRTSRDNRVRDEHEKRNGVEFLWTQPPPDGHPGEPVLCRCYADPIFD